MSLILLISIALRGLAFAWSIVLWRRLRDWRVGFLTVMLAFMTLRQALTIITSARASGTISIDWLGHLTELPGLLVSAMAVAAVHFLVRLFESRDETARRVLETEQRLSSITHASPDHVMLVDLERRVEYVNRTVDGLSISEVLGRPMDDFVPEDDRANMHACFARVRASGDPDRYVVRYVAAAGETRVFESHVGAIRDAAGRVTGFAVSSRDVSDLKRNESELDELRVALENGMTGISRLDREGRFVEVREAYAGMLGFEASEMIGMSWEPTVVPEDRPAAAATYGRMLDEGQASVEVRARRKDGTTFFKYILLVKRVDESGAHDGHYCFMRDVTSRRETQTALEASEAKYRAVVEDVPSMICRHTPELVLTFVNEAYARQFGRTVDELVGTCFLDLVPREFHPALIDHHAGLDRHRPVATIEHQARAADGGLCWQQWTNRALLDRRGRVTGFQSIGQDITHRKRAEDRQRLMMRELDHRVRNNLTALTGLIELTGRSTRDLDAFAESIAGRVGAMATVHEVLSQSRWSPVPLHAILEQLTPPECPGRVVVNGPEFLVPAAQGTALGMVVHELMSNSLKYGALGTPGGCVEVRWTTPPEADGHLHVTWTENGGPPIDVAGVPGLGTELVTGLVRSDLRGTVELKYPAHGAEHVFDLDLQPTAAPAELVSA